MTFPPLIIWAKATFFFEQLFSVVARTWLGLKSDRLFLGPKFRFLVQKSDFCHTTPILVNDPFLALVMAVNFPPWERFFDFPFRSYSCFRKKNPGDGSKSLPPSHCGILLHSNSPSALSVQALLAGWINAESTVFSLSCSLFLWFILYEFMGACRLVVQNTRESEDTKVPEVGVNMSAQQSLLRVEARRFKCNK